MSLFSRGGRIGIVALSASLSVLAQSDNGSVSDTGASPADVAKSILQTELPPPAQFFTEPTGSGGSECYVKQPFNGETLTTRVSVAAPSAAGDIAATIMRHNDRDGENTHDQTVVVRLLDTRGKVKFELFARRAASDVQVCTAPGGFMKTCSQHPTVGKWVTLADPEIVEALQNRREAALKACLVKHRDIQGRHSTDAELGSSYDKPAHHP